MFGKLFKGKETKNSEEVKEELKAKNVESSDPLERILVAILETVRGIYFKRGLVGSIDVSKTFLFVGSSVSCDINAVEEEREEKEKEEADESWESQFSIELISDLSSTKETSASSAIDDGNKNSPSTLVVASSTNALLDGLSRRAINYSCKSYKDRLTVSGSVNISVSVMTFTISCSATVSSLLASAAQKKKNECIK